MKITRRKRIMASTDLGYNQMNIQVRSGISSDGFKITIIDSQGNILFKNSYNYGYDASYSRDFASDRAPYVTDIINKLCDKYNISDNEIHVSAGDNIFRGDKVDNKDVEDFINTYVHGCDDVLGATEVEDTPEFDVFMLMDYYPGDEGMESDMFECCGKFFARDIEDAKQQLKDCIRKYPNVASDSMYVSEYNEYFDNFDASDPYDYHSNEVFEDLDVLFKEFNDNMEDYEAEFGDEPLPYASSHASGTAIEAADDVEESDDFDSRWDEKFGEPSTEVFSTEDFFDWMKEVSKFE